MATVPAWTNGPLEVYHGTDSDTLAPFSLLLGRPLSGFTIDLNKCRANTDFGLGFYVTTSLLQAQNWANSRVTRKQGRRRTRAVVLSFTIDRDWLASLDALCFVAPSAGFFDLVKASRAGIAPHQRAGSQSAYDVVYGPVTLYPQLALVANSDQISFHTHRAASGMPEPTVFDLAPNDLIDVRYQ